IRARHNFKARDFGACRQSAEQLPESFADFRALLFPGLACAGHFELSHDRRLFEPAGCFRFIGPRHSEISVVPNLISPASPFVNVRSLISATRRSELPVTPLRIMISEIYGLCPPTISGIVLHASVVSPK